ncbi:hypothetical protein [Mycobacterium sp. M23085]|uniref:hypothetical protein n=1 Tax=Mycobacterium sp. M23085 TaxID=3378087 RepID=UPI003877CE28
MSTEPALRHLGPSTLTGLPSDAMRHSMTLAHNVVQQLSAQQAGLLRAAVDRA